MIPNASQRSMLLLLAACGLAGAAQGASLEERFKAYLDGLRAKGTAAASVAASVPEATTPVTTTRTDGLPLGADQAVIFVSATCRSCGQAAERMKRFVGVPVVMNISTSAVAREAFGVSGAKAVPAILFGRRLITGYSDAAMERAAIDDMQDKGNASVGQGS